MFNEMKQELKNNDSTVNDLKNSPSLNFDDGGTFISDKNCHVLTGLTRDQFNDLCNYIYTFNSIKNKRCEKHHAWLLLLFL